MNEQLTLSNKQLKLSKWFIKNNIKNKHQFLKYPQVIYLNYNGNDMRLSKRNIYYTKDKTGASVYFFEDIKYVYMFVDIDVYNVNECVMLLYDKHRKTIEIYDDTKMEISDI